MTAFRYQRDKLLKSPWKNGGGITRVIHKSGMGVPLWRLSIADVETDGPFSSFEGMDRILTVVEGDGMILRGSQSDYTADIHMPVRFSGEEAIVGQLKNGPIQDFNLIYDRKAWEADAEIVAANKNGSLESKPCNVEALFCLAGRLRIADHRPLMKYEGIVLEDEFDPLLIYPEKDGLGLLIRLRSLVDEDE